MCDVGPMDPDMSQREQIETTGVGQAIGVLGQGYLPDPVYMSSMQPYP